MAGDLEAMLRHIEVDGRFHPRHFGALTDNTGHSSEAISDATTRQEVDNYVPSTQSKTGVRTMKLWRAAGGNSSDNDFGSSAVARTDEPPPLGTWSPSVKTFQVFESSRRRCLYASSIERSAA
ncbi:uncharacterized protein TRAVEDRAFT_42631 [Trametes versicolor FP-101664 SS1]|uniref:uncharacterized protein n=1 Tax=Trametes versicolor (strain FP-101664) TaxID=717944 RepID=UPI000462480D|nr:uncharacterized protein TRAVEDRAFT_42631 [Trametes versicolor FP-101664 SS1]EIW65253.1 hypothetical protein TRAVEDRAFT_42631 [Trametes versicolor FP-101664 SS1]